MKKFFVIAFFILCIFEGYSQSDKSDFLHRFTCLIEKAESYSFYYKSGTVKGEVVIANREMYLSQSDKLEIYEKDEVRFSHNIKRSKVDIDKIKGAENGGIVIFNWIKNIENYKLLLKETDKKKNVIYKLENKTDENEKIEILFDSKGVLMYIVYQNKNIKKVKINIEDFQTNKKMPSQFFKFNPDLRKDLDVTDYR